MIKVFSPRALTMAVNMMTPAPTKVLDKIFARKKAQLSSNFEWDVKSSTEQIMENISPSAEATVRGGIGRKNVTCKAPRYSEKEFISAEDLEEMRKFGSENQPELLKNRVGEEQYDMRQNFDLTREFQAVKCLSGQVVDKHGTVLVDYNLPAAHKPVLSGAALWTDDASDPITNIRAWKKQIVRGGGIVNGWWALAGESAMTALMNNKNALEKIKYTAGKQIADEGSITHLAGVDIEEYMGSYLDPDGVTRHEMIPDDVFCLVGFIPDGAAELYAPVVDLKAATGVGKGKQAQVFFSKMWEKDDPSGVWIKVEGRPLPVLFRIISVWAKVVA